MPFVIFALLTKNQNKSVSVNQFADLCPFIIRKNKVFPTNSDKNISFFLFWILCSKQSICQHHRSTCSDLPRCATHKQKQHCSRERFLALPFFSIIIAQAHAAERALLSTAISGDYTTTPFKPNMYQHSTAQGKENLPAPSVSP